MSRDSDLREQLTAAVETLERIGSGSLLPSVVLSIHAKTLLVAVGEDRLVVLKDPKTSFKVGDTILLERETRAYIRHSEFNTLADAVVTVLSVNEANGTVEIDVAGQRRIIHSAVEDVRVGDKGIADRGLNVLMALLPREEIKEFSAPSTGVTWADIGGNEDAKEALIEAIEHPETHRDLYEFYGAKATSGILLLGPPGCGKTMLGKAAATALGSIDGFIYVKGPEILNSYVGESEAAIRGLFQRARNYKERTGRKAIIFIDEGDAILSDRSARSAHMEKTIVPMFLSEMDGLEEKAATVILSTNRPQALDPAVVREGRFDRKISVTRPRQNEAEEILKTHLKKVPTLEDREALAKNLAATAFEATFEHKGQVLPLSNYISGAILAGVVEKAKVSAMRRDIAAGTKGGIGVDDLNAGLTLTVKELGNASIEH